MSNKHKQLSFLTSHYELIQWSDDDDDDDNDDDEIDDMNIFIHQENPVATKRKNLIKWNTYKEHIS